MPLWKARQIGVGVAAIGIGVAGAYYLGYRLPDVKKIKAIGKTDTFAKDGEDKSANNSKVYWMSKNEGTCVDPESFAKIMMPGMDSDRIQTHLETIESREKLGSVQVDVACRNDKLEDKTKDAKEGQGKNRNVGKGGDGIDNEVKETMEDILLAIEREESKKDPRDDLARIVTVDRVKEPVSLERKEVKETLPNARTENDETPTEVIETMNGILDAIVLKEKEKLQQEVANKILEEMIRDILLKQREKKQQEVVNAILDEIIKAIVLKEKERNEAKETLPKAITENDETPTQEEMFEDALEDCSEDLKIEPEKAVDYMQLAEHNLKNENYQMALIDYAAAYYMAGPGNNPVASKMAARLIMKKSTERVDEYLKENGLFVKPKVGKFFDNYFYGPLKALANIVSKQDSTTNSEESDEMLELNRYLQAFTTDPTCDSSYLEAGKILAARNQLQEALECVEKGLKFCQTEEILYSMLMLKTCIETKQDMFKYIGHEEVPSGSDEITPEIEIPEEDSQDKESAKSGSVSKNAFSSVTSFVYNRIPFRCFTFKA